MSRRAAAAVALVTTLAATSGLVATPANAGGPGGVGGYLERTLPARASGTVVAVHGRDVTCHGFGLADRESGVPATCDTVYDIGSVTKQFTAAAVLRLQQTGRLDVHDPIARWLGPVPPDKAPITLQQLLTHTSGLVASLGGDYDRLTRRQLVARALASRLRTPPGAAYHYSNVGYSLLALVVERASGQDYERFLARELFGPAGMRSTGYVLPDWSLREVAVEYDGNGDARGRPFDHPWAADGPWWNLRGNGGMLSSARDLVRWHRALSRHRTLDARTTRELFRPRVAEQPGGESWYGYGWVLLDTQVGRVAWHNGGNGWSYAELTRVLGRRTMVFWATNQVRRTGHWNLSRLPLTSEVVLRLLRPLRQAMRPQVW